MIHCSFKLTKKFALDIAGLHFYRSFKDGISWFDFHINSDWYKGDHNPKFEIIISICNLMILDFEIYNVYHKRSKR